MGYEARGEYGISGRSYFKKPPIGQMVGFHLHADIVGSYRVKGIWRFLVKPQIAAQYAALKTELSFHDGCLKPEYQCPLLTASHWRH